MFNKLLKTISLLLLITFLYSCDSNDSIVENNSDYNGIIGSGNVIENQYGFKDFSQVKLSHAFKCKIIKGDEFKIILRIDDNLTEYVQVKTSDQLLSIKLNNGYSYKNVNLEAEIIMPDINSIDLSAACSGSITGFNFNHPFTIKLSEACNLASTITTGDLDIILSGASNAALLGRGSKLDLTLSGASNIEMASFNVTSATVLLSGASRAKIYTNGHLDVIVSGASSLFYSGNPQLGNINISGASTVQKM